MDPKDIQGGSSQMRKEHAAEQTRQHERPQRKTTCFCANCKGLKAQKEGLRNAHMHQWGPMVSSDSAEPSIRDASPKPTPASRNALPPSHISGKENISKTSQDKCNTRTSQSKGVIEQDYAVVMPKLLELQEKHGMSDTSIDQLLSLLHNKIMHPGNSCPGSIAEARELISKSSCPS